MNATLTNVKKILAGLHLYNGWAWHANVYKENRVSVDGWIRKVLENNARKYSHICVHIVSTRRSPYDTEAEEMLAALRENFNVERLPSDKYELYAITTKTEQT